MRKSRILISYTNTGSGHKIPAQTIAEKIEELYPEKYEIMLSNFFEDVGTIRFNNYIEQSWNLMLKYSWYMKLVMFLSHLFYRSAPFYVKVCHPKVWRVSKNYLKKINPDIIFSTHFFTTSVAVSARRSFKLSFPIISLNPDSFHTYPQWPKKGDMVLVHSAMALESAYRLGHNPEKVALVPQVLRKECQQIFSSHDQDQLKKKHCIRANVLTVFMCDGGQGVGKMWVTLQSIVKSNLKVNIIAVTAKNHKLYQKLSILKKKLDDINSPIQLTVFGFIDFTVQLMSISDLFVGKGGPATTSESLNRGVPVIINLATSWTEQKQAKVFAEEGVAWIITNPKKIAQFISMLIAHPESLETAREKIKKLDYSHSGSERIVQIIVDTLEYNATIVRPEEIKIILDKL